jgi:hypothetical protein
MKTEIFAPRTIGLVLLATGLIFMSTQQQTVSAQVDIPSMETSPLTNQTIQNPTQNTTEISGNLTDFRNVTNATSE